MDVYRGALTIGASCALVSRTMLRVTHKGITYTVYSETALVLLCAWLQVQDVDAQAA